jgi:hypothetical protein
MTRQSIELEQIEPPSRTQTDPSVNSSNISQRDEAGDLGLNTSRHEFGSLPPVDGGKDAWLFLAAGFVFEALVWGKLPVAT